ncbi:uncharacterized protein LOC144587591 isoform X2 [Pogona vitticeps]
MKLSSGRMPLRVNFALIFAMTLLSGVKPMSIHKPEETIAATSATVATAYEAGGLEKEVTPDKYEFDDNEVERDYSEVGLTPLDDSTEFDEATSPGAATASPQDSTTGGTRVTEENNLEEPPKNNDKPEDDVADNPIGLDEHDETEEDALNLIRLMVKRAIEEDEDEDDEAQPETIDEDDFSFSDMSKIFEPLIEAFSQVESGAPAPEDVFSWLPALKDLLQPKEEPSASQPTDLPPDTAERRSNFPTSLGPSLQIAPAASPEQPAESEILPSPSLLEESVTPFQPTFPAPIQSSPPSPSNVPDSEDRSY